MAKQPDEARKHLQRPAALCASSCEEYRHLDSAIAAYAKKRPWPQYGSAKPLESRTRSG